MTEPAIIIRSGEWEDLSQWCRPLRELVFITEQGITREEEWDGLDRRALHFVLFADNQAVGTARLLPDGHVGRVAIHPEWRGKGLGQDLLRQVLLEARHQGHTHLMLSAQLHALSFYEQLGFTAQGEPYTEAGIPHRDMSCTLA